MKKIIPLAVLIILSLFLSIVFYFKSDRNQFIKSNINQFLANNPAIRWEARESLVAIERLVLIPISFISEDKDKLPTLNLSATPTDISKLVGNLPIDKFRSHFGEINKNPVPATFSAGGQSHQALIRFRGDNYNHWAFPKKSWRVELQEGSYDGMQVFNLIIPEDGAFVQELFSIRLAKRLNLITPKAYFVTLRLNGGGKLIYLLVEHRTKILIETNKRPEGNLIGESNLITPYDSVLGVQIYETKEGDYFDLASIDFLQQLIKDPDNNRFNTLLPTVLDMESTLKWIAHSTVMFSRAQKDSHNFLTFLNPATGKLEFIPWNADMSDLDPSNSPIDTDYNTLVTRILKNPKWKKDRNKYALQLIGDQNQLKDDLVWIDKTRERMRPAVYKDDLRLFLVTEFELSINQFKDRYTQSFKKINKELHE